MSIIETFKRGSTLLAGCRSATAAVAQMFVRDLNVGINLPIVQNETPNEGAKSSPLAPGRYA
jgi:hypothetical protein